MSSLPSGYGFNLRRLTGYGRNNYKIQSSTVSHNLQAWASTSFDLPSNVLCDLRSFKVYCTVKCNDSATGRIPGDPRSILQKVEISAGGVQLSHGCTYFNRVCQALSILDGHDCDEGMVQSVSHNSFDKEFTGTTGETRRMCIQNLPGLFTDANVSVLDTALIPDLQITLYFASNTVMSKSAGIGDSDFVKVHDSASSTYTIDDCFASIDTISIGNDSYSNMVSAFMNRSEEQCLKISFPDYSTIHDSGEIIRFSVATNSLDRVMCLLCSDNQSYPVPIDGTALAARKYDSPVSSSSDKLFQSAYVNSSLPSTATTLQLTCNGSQFPQYEVKVEDLFHYVSPKKAMTYSQFNKNYAVFVHQFSDSDRFVISGVDTRGSNLQGHLTVTGAASTVSSMLVVESTTVLRIYPGRQFKVER
eukprot:4140244-Pleurochrysis_carterae.AAC.4